MSRIIDGLDDAIFDAKVRTIIAHHMGLRDLLAVDDCFADLLNFEHGEIFAAVCADLERQAGIPALTDSEIAEIHAHATFPTFVSLMRSKRDEAHVPIAKGEQHAD